MEEQRGLSSPSQVKLGMDGGGGFLKICLNLLAQEADDGNKGDRGTKWKDSGVKKLMIVGL